MNSPAGYMNVLFSGKRLHLLFCLGLLLFFTLMAFDRHDMALLPGLLFTYLYLLAGIYTGRWICKGWFLAGKWASLLVASLLAVMVFALTGLVGVYFLFVRVSLHNVGDALLESVTVGSGILFTGFFIAVTRSAIREKMNGLVLAEQKKASELSLLRSQVSPHFLFNTLNNLYSLSINRPAQLPGLLLKLSELLRYTVYQTEQTWVSLDQELDYLRNYVALEAIRVSDRLILSLKLDPVPTEARIAPMLLIVFAENAFKHARETPAQQIIINISLRITTEKISFVVINSSGDQHEGSSKAGRSGFGLDNVIKRLNLLYPAAYRLQQSRPDGLFKVELELNYK